MKSIAGLCFLLLVTATNLIAADKPRIANPAIDMDTYLKSAATVAGIREPMRVTEAEFIRLSAEPGVVILDARSAEGFRKMHVKGAVNLDFADITADSLARVIPAKETRVLIYCNNNFSNALSAFPTKAPSASLNLSTYIALYTYGYTQVYELGPFLDARKTKIEFEPAVN